MKTPLNKDAQAFIPRNKNKTELNINAKEFIPKNQTPTNTIKIGATYYYNGINSDYCISNKSNIKKIVVTAFTENGDAICHLISSQKNQNYENNYVEVELGENHKKTYYVSTNNHLIVGKEQFRNDNENITIQSDVISQNKIDEINNKSKNTNNFYTINNKSQNNYNFHTLPENYGQQFTHDTIFYNSNYGINDGYGNMFYGY